MQTDDAATQLDTMRAEIMRGMIEHEIVMQALRAQAIVSALFVLVLGGLCFLLWQRYATLLEAFHGAIARHSNERIEQVKSHSSERIALVKQHSLEQSSLQMQLLHAFEGIVSRRRPTSGASPNSSGSATPQQTHSTSSPPPLPQPNPPPPVPISNKRRTPQQ